MNAFEDERPARYRPAPDRRWPQGTIASVGLALMGLGLVVAVYNACKIEVDTGQQAVLIRKEGLELEPDMELAPPPKDGGAYYKGVQSGGPNNGVLTEGRYFYNPYFWSWEISPQFVVPGDKIGIRIALSGDDMPAGQILAEPGQKGILREVLKPGRYPYNPYAESIELHDPVTIPAGLRGVVTRLAGPMPKNPNVFLVEDGERGVQTQDARSGNLLPQSLRDPGQPGRLPVAPVQPGSRRRDELPVGRRVPDHARRRGRVPHPAREGRRDVRQVQRVIQRRCDRRGDHRQDHHARESIALPDRRLQAFGRPVHQRRGPREVSDRPGQEPDRELPEAGDRDPRRGDHLDPASRGHHPAGAATGGRQAEARAVPAREAPAALRGEIEESRWCWPSRRSAWSRPSKRWSRRPPSPRRSRKWP